MSVCHLDKHAGCPPRERNAGLAPPHTQIQSTKAPLGWAVCTKFVAGGLRQVAIVPRRGSRPGASRERRVRPREKGPPLRAWRKAARYFRSLSHRAAISTTHKRNRSQTELITPPKICFVNNESLRFGPEFAKPDEHRCGRVTSRFRSTLKGAYREVANPFLRRNADPVWWSSHRGPCRNESTAMCSEWPDNPMSDRRQRTDVVSP